MKKAFEVKQKNFFLVSQVLIFRLKKQTSKNVAGTTFKENELETLQDFVISIPGMQCPTLTLELLIK